MSNQESRNQLQQKAPLSSNYTDEATVPTATWFDKFMWLIAIILLLGALLANQYLPAYWAEANNITVRIGVIAACVVTALGLIYATHQGKALVQLARDSQTELKRVSWPSKQSTLATSWQILVVVVLAALFLSAADFVFNKLIKFIIG